MVGTLALGCGGEGASTRSVSSGASAAEEMLCPQLSSGADPLVAEYGAPDSANGRIAAFVAAARGMHDVVLEMERLTINACTAIAADTPRSTPIQAAQSTVEAACAPVLEHLTALREAGIELRMRVSPPRCEGDDSRSAECQALCAASGGRECAPLCAAHEALYAQCTLPSVAIAISSTSPGDLAFVKALERHLPSLLYAEAALGARLAEHFETLADVAIRLPADLGSAGTMATACATLSAKDVVASVQYFEALATIAQRTTAIIDTETIDQEPF